MGEHPEFTLKTIMLATDLSSASYGALDYARKLARQFAAKILLTHVIDCSAFTPSQKNDLCETIDRAERELQEAVEQLSEDFIESRVIVRQGNIRETILGLIAERKVDLLVLGTRGRTLNAAEGIGSNAEALLRVMPCPVLAVGAKAKTNAVDVPISVKSCFQLTSLEVHTLLFDMRRASLVGFAHGYFLSTSKKEVLAARSWNSRTRRKTLEL